MSFVITIDGPAAAGKSTTARAVAARLGILYLDTGALYRALALKVLECGISADDPAAVEACVNQTELDLSESPDRIHVWVDGTDVSDRIRTPAVSELSSRLAAQPAVRRRLVEIQRSLAARGPVIAEGRDLGTVVFPDAEIKVFLDAALATRASRRHREMERHNIATAQEQVLEDLERRDARDRDRIESPLKPAADAVVLDTSNMDIEAQVEAVLRLARAHARCPGRR